MSSLLLPILGYLVVSAAAGVVGHRIARRGARRFTIAIASAVVLILLANALVLADHPLWVRVLPLENVWLYSNPTLPGACLLAGLVFRMLPPIGWQRLLLTSALVALGIERSLGGLYRPAPGMTPGRWSGETCRQSTKSTCAPAAAASALRAVGIDSGELALAGDAFSLRDGTSNLTLYRALRRATSGTTVHVSAYRGSVEGLPVPAVVVLSPTGVATTLLPIGGRHAVAVLRREADGTLVIADPFSGTQRWPARQLAALWTGSALTLLQSE